MCSWPPHTCILILHTSCIPAYKAFPADSACAFPANDIAYTYTVSTHLRVLLATLHVCVYLFCIHRVCLHTRFLHTKFLHTSCIPAYKVFPADNACAFPANDIAYTYTVSTHLRVLLATLHVCVYSFCHHFAHTSRLSVPIPRGRPIQSNPSTIQSNPIQSDPIQSNPMQSNPIQSNPIQSNPTQPNPIQPNPIQSNPSTLPG